MNWEDHESKRMEPAGMEPLGCERHGWADPRGRGFRAEAETSGATWTGSPKGVFAERKHHKPRQGVVTSTLNAFRGGAVGFIDWLGRKTWTNRACGRHKKCETVRLMRLALLKTGFMAGAIP